MGGSLTIYFPWRGLSIQNAELRTRNTELSAQNAEFRRAVLGGSGSRYLFEGFASAASPKVAWLGFSGDTGPNRGSKGRK